MRAGQPLGALLGYRLERGLHENHRELVLDRYIAPLRALAPLDALTAAEHDLSVALDRQARGGRRCSVSCRRRDAEAQGRRQRARRRQIAHGAGRARRGAGAAAA